MSITYTNFELMLKPFQITLTFLALVLCLNSRSQDVENDQLMKILKNELNREFSILSKQEYPAYFIEYKAVEQKQISVGSNFGTIMTASIDSARQFSTSVRVGSYQLDNTHSISDYGYGNNYTTVAELPWGFDAHRLNVEMWQATNDEYYSAVDSYKQVLEEKDNIDFKNEEADFSSSDPVNYYEVEQPGFINNDLLELWKKQANELTGLFVDDTTNMLATALFSAYEIREYSATTENQFIVQNKRLCNFTLVAASRASDDQPVYNMLSFTANSPSEMASFEEIKAETLKLIALLKDLKNAPLADPYSGPALLSPQASGVFFHEIFGHRVEGHRLAEESDSHTFKDKLGKQVLPKYIDVTFDPTIKEYNGKFLTGNYVYDDQGVKSQKVEVVKKGILTDFLMSRRPVEGLGKSNGHGRAMFGSTAVSRQSNMIVSADKTFSEEELRKKLISECKKQHKEYGLYFKQVTGGLTLNSVYSANVFTVFPTEIYRIYTDGRPDELIRQVSLIGTPLTMFSEIEAAGDDPELFAGICGAESGSIPVTIVSPSFFVKKIETQRNPDSKFERTILNMPKPLTH